MSDQKAPIAAPGSDAFSAADAGAQPVVTPAVTQPDPPEVQSALKAVGIGGQSSEPAGAAQAGQPSDGQSASEDPRDEYFRSQQQAPLYNDIKAAPSVDHGQPEASKPVEGPIIA